MSIGKGIAIAGVWFSVAAIAIYANQEVAKLALVFGTLSTLAIVAVKK